MYIKFDRVAHGGKDNKGSCSDFIHYMMKEDNRSDKDVEWWFDQNSNATMSKEVQDAIDSDHKGLHKKAAKFTTGSISPSEREWAAMGSTDAARRENFKRWVAEHFTKEYAANFNKKDKAGNPINIAPDNIKIYYKFEYNRYYKGTDEEKTDGKVRAGDAKQGFNCHIHFIVATKTADSRYCVNPKTFNKTEFNRVNFFQKIEQSFDRRFDFQRQREDSFAYYMSGIKLQSTRILAKAFEEHGGNDEEQDAEQAKQRREKEL